MPIKCTRMAGPSVPAARALGLAVLRGGCVSHSTAGPGSCCTHLVVVLFDLPLKDVRETGEAAVLKATILTQLLPYLLPLRIFQAMWSESGGGSERCPSDFELSLCKTTEK